MKEHLRRIWRGAWIGFAYLAAASVLLALGKEITSVLPGLGKEMTGAGWTPAFGMAQGILMAPLLVPLVPFAGRLIRERVAGRIDGAGVIDAIKSCVVCVGAIVAFCAAFVFIVAGIQTLIGPRARESGVLIDALVVPFAVAIHGALFWTLGTYAVGAKRNRILGWIKSGAVGGLCMLVALVLIEAGAAIRNTDFVSLGAMLIVALWWFFFGHFVRRAWNDWRENRRRS